MTIMWQGELLHIHISDQAGAPMRGLGDARLIAGIGVEGDRYQTGKGKYSEFPDIREVTLIEVETLEALARDEKVELAPHEHRRNLTTRGVPLNHLVGRRFRVGDVVLEGGRLNVPCRYLELLTSKSVYQPLLNRSGLNCRIIEGGVIRVGDRVEGLT